jgi:hypothetical protein
MNAYPGAIASEAPLDLAAACGDPRHGFFRSAWFEDAERILVVRGADGSVAGALPLVKRGPFLQAVPGCYWPMRSFPLAADADLPALLAGVPAPVLRVGPVRADDPTLQRLAAVGGWTLLPRRVGTCFVQDIAASRAAGDWPRSSTLRKNRWFEKQLAAQGALRFETVAGRGWTASAFDSMAEIERNSWIPNRTDARDAKFLAPHHRRVWERAAADPVLASMMRGCILFIGERPAAFTFGIECGRVFYFIANSYDRMFARHSPGRVLGYREMARLLEAGVDEIDWGIGDPGYKTVIGAVPGPDMVDCLLVRNRFLAAALRPLWAR